MSYTPPPAPQPYLPKAPPVPPKSDSSVASRNDINSTASDPKDTQAQVAAENAPLRIVYGRARIGAQVADVLSYQNNLIMVLVWCEGEIEQIETITVGDETPDGSIVLTNYLGTAGQTVNSTLVSAYASHGITYTDTLAGIAYSVAVIPVGVTSGFPTFNAIIKGKKLYDPRTTLTVYSDNPALALSDFIQSTVYGMVRTSDMPSVITAANFCDEIITGEKRRIIGLCIDSVSPCTQWVETLRTYAGCFVSQEGSSVKLIADKTGSSVFSFTATNIVANSLKLRKLGIQQVPTLMDVRYTDTNIVPWTEKSAIVKVAGVDEGTTSRRESQVSLPGIARYSQAYREATERLNKLSLSDLYVEFNTFDEALAVQIGDIISVTHPIGLTAKLMRVTSAKIIDGGRWTLSALEYDPAAYSDTVTAEPTYTDTTLPNPAAPPTITGIVAVEEVYQLENGTYASRIKTTWDAVTFPYLASYRIEIYQSGVLIDTANPISATYRTAAVQEGLEYVVKVATITTIGSVGAWAQANITAAGKYLIPGDVPSVDAFEAGGTAYIAWEPAIDIDIWRYEVKYGPVGGTYAAATQLDLVDGLRYQTDMIPPGTWTLHVKAVDSVRQRSTTAATCAITVTIDAAAFLISVYNQTNPTVANMAEYRLAPTDTARYWVTEDGAAMDTKFTGALTGYPDVMATYHAPVTGTWTGEAEDFGLLLSGSWTGAYDTTLISGSPTSHIELSDDATTWNTSPSTSAKDTARFARLLHQSLTTDTLMVKAGTQQVRLDAIPREEIGTGTSSAAGPVTITLANTYTAVKQLTITPQGTTARTATFDNILIGTPTTFDVYVFDSAGTKIASPFRYAFQGV